MKKMTCVLVALVAFSFSAVAFAENLEQEQEREYRFRAEALNSLVLLPAYFYFSIFIHEAGHALGAVASGLEVHSFKPYPHYTVRNGELMSYWGANYIWSRGGMSNTIFSTLAPYIVDTLFFAVSDLLLNYLPSFRNSFFGSVVFFAGMVFPFIDFVHNLYTSAEGSDFNVASDILGERRAMFCWFGSILTAIGAWRIIQTGLRVFVEGFPEPRTFRERHGSRRQNRRRVSNVQISPTFGEVNGLSFSMSM